MMCTTQASVIILGKYSTKVYPSPLSADLAMSSSQVMTFSGGVGYLCVRIACSKSKSWNTACHSCLRTGERAINNLQHTAIHFGFTNFSFHLLVNSPLLHLSHMLKLIQLKIILLLPFSIPPRPLPTPQKRHQQISRKAGGYNILGMVIYVCEIVAGLPRLTQQKFSHSPLQILGDWLDIVGLGIYGVSLQNQEAKRTLLTHQQLCLLWSVFLSQPGPFCPLAHCACQCVHAMKEWDEDFIGI